MLDHAYMWGTKPEPGYQLVSLDKARELYPEGRSLLSRTFFCQNCLQALVLTKSNNIRAYFRHDANTLNKACSDRSAFDRDLASEGVCPLSLKMRVDHDHIKFFLGFAYPSYAIGDPDSGLDSIEYRGNSACSDNTVLNVHFNKHGTTYIHVGNTIQECYKLSYHGARGKLKNFWPAVFEAVPKQGSFFEYVADESDPQEHIYVGKLIPRGSLVDCNRKYLLLTYHLISSSHGPKSIKLEHICHFGQWNLFAVSIKEFDKEAADFFLRWNVLLTSRERNLDIIWPPHVRVDNILSFNKKQQSSPIFAYSHGESCLRMLSPNENIKPIEVYDGGFFKLSSPNDTNMVMLGFKGKQGLIYLNQQENLDFAGACPKVSLSNSHGREIELSGSSMEIVELPHDEGEVPKVKIRTPFDGVLEIEHDGMLDRVARIRGDQPLDLQLQDAGKVVMRVFQGLDCVKSFEFVQPAVVVQELISSPTVYEELEQEYQLPAIGDSDLYAQLQQCRGRSMEIRHNVGIWADQLEGYTQCRSYLRKCVREGEIPQDAYHLLRGHLAHMPSYLERLNQYRTQNVDVVQYHTQAEVYDIPVVQEV